MEISSSNHTGFHCKVACDGQFRRFLFNGTEFAALKRQVGTLLGLPAAKEFVLKYQDEEGDLITIETDEELACAVGYSKDPTLLRLFVEVGSAKDEKVVEKVVECDFSDGEEKGKKWKCKRGRGKYMHPYDRDEDGRGHHEFAHGHCHGRGRGRGHGHGHGQFRHEKKWWKEDENCKGKWKCDKQGKREVIRLNKKKDRLASTLQFLEKIPQSEGNYTLRERRITHIKEKLALIDLKLNTLPQQAKRHELTEEEKKQLYLIHERITTIKFIISETKAQLRQKKGVRELSSPEAQAVHDAEVDEMKVTIWDLKKQVRDLKEQMFLIHHPATAESTTSTAPSTGAAGTATSPASIKDVTMT